jgi:hypothetical protein
MGYERRTVMDNTQIMRGAKAPGPSTPGGGSGNVPFAPGLMSGRNLGQQTNTAPLARQAGGGGGVTLNINSGGPPPEQPAQTPQTPAMPQMPSVLTPQNYMQVLDAYMNALLESVKSGRPLIGGIY